MAERKTPRFSPSSVRVTGGTLLALFALMLLLSPCTRLRYLAYPLHFLFGNSGLWVFSLLLLEGGLHLVFRPKWIAYPRRAKLGILVAAIGLWALIGQAAGLPLVPNDFAAALNETYAVGGPALYAGSELMPGYFGCALLTLLNGAGLWLGYLLSIAILLLGLVLALFRPLRFAIVSLRAKVVLSAAEKGRRIERDEYGNERFEVQPEEDLTVNPAIPQTPVREEPPALTFSAPRAEASNGPIVFARAGGNTLPSRRELRGKATEVPTPSGTPVTAYPPTAPVEIPTPQFPSAKPIRTSGLREAVFTLPGMDAPAPEPPTPGPEAPATPAEPDFLAGITPNIPVATPVEKPESAVVAPVPEPEPEEDEEPVVIDDSDIDEAPMPTNDPIVLTPNPTSIVPPEPEPEPEPVKAPEPEPEPEPEVDDDEETPLPPYTYPPSSLLALGESVDNAEKIRAECERRSHEIDTIFANFNVGAHVSDFLVGPSITRYSIVTDPGVSVSTVARVISDMEVLLGGVSVRYVERVFGMACSAIEVANETRRTVPFKEVFEALPPYSETADLHIPFGVAIDGSLKEANLSKFPHMLIAGTSGSGKSIFAHGILMSLIMRNRPENLKLVLIDPKRGVEMAPYKDLPHLFCPIIKEAKPARNALKKLCEVMDQRYERFSETSVRDIGSYNADYALPNHKKRMPYIVVFVDEFADLVGECKDISDYVLRIAQKARACGIHLIVATQRPDVKVITGTIKSNLLCRVALTVASTVDSQTILGVGGAEALYGYGDMLTDCQELSKRDFVRAQGCLAVPKEMKAVCDFIRGQMGPQYDPAFMNLEGEDEDSGPEVRDGGYAPIAPMPVNPDGRKASDEEKYQTIKRAIMTREYCSISMIQRTFEVGFPRAGKIFARLVSEGIVAAPGDAPNNSRGCPVLVHELPEEEG